MKNHFPGAHFDVNEFTRKRRARRAKSGDLGEIPEGMEADIHRRGGAGRPARYNAGLPNIPVFPALPSP